jgi:tryptophan synthase alpha chain
VSRLDASFARAAAERRGHLIIYLTAGDPSLEATADLAVALAGAGVDAIELGIPFSDPLADGPVIQAAAQRALERGCTVQGVMDCVRGIRARSDIPLAFMTCYNPILQRGPERFAGDSREAGVDAVLVTDLPPGEAGEWCAQLAAKDLGAIFLVAPSSPPERVKLATKLSTAFVYCVSRPGVTGVREELPADLRELVARIRLTTDHPIAVGFGISRPEHVREVCRFADGAIVGSAMVRLVAEQDDPVPAAVAFAQELATGKHEAG